LPKLKEVFTYAVSKSAFPYFTWLDFSDYCISVIKVLDKNCTISKLDMAFIATNVELVEVLENPDRDLCRYEFFEIILRIANDKYRIPKIEPTFASAYKRMINECVLPNYNPIF
jgi:hypothetical protein